MSRRRERLSVRNQLQAIHAKIMATVVSHKGCAVKRSGSGDPGVGALHTAAGGLRSHHHFGLLTAEIRAGWHYCESLQIQAQPVQPFAPRR